jgi:hypothetical protein
VKREGGAGRASFLLARHGKERREQDSPQDSQEVLL